MNDIARICAEKRADDAAAEIERLLAENARLADKALRYERAANELRSSHLAALDVIQQGISREDAMRAAFGESLATIKRIEDGLAQACLANDALTGQIRDRDRQIAEMRQRIVENAEAARAVRIGVVA